MLAIRCTKVNAQSDDSGCKSLLKFYSYDKESVCIELDFFSQVTTSAAIQQSYNLLAYIGVRA